MDGVAAPLDLNQFSLSGNEVEMRMEWGPGTPDLIRMEAARAKIEHATLTTSSGYSLEMSDLSIKSLRYSHTSSVAAPEDDRVEIITVKLVFRSSKGKHKDRPKDDKDDWKDG
jgi:hypothetical protein